MMDPLLLVILAFSCELIDTSIGGGYGTILVPLAINFGIDPLIIVPAVLFSEICTGILGGFFHYRFGNIDFRIVIMDGILGMVGVGIGVLLGINVPSQFLKGWIAFIIIICGLFLLLSLREKFIVTKFRLRNDIPLTLICSFNKGLSGGGYGPISTAGLIIIRANPKKAVGSTILSEGIVCIIGFLMYYAYGKTSLLLNPITPYITIGAC